MSKNNDSNNERGRQNEYVFKNFAKSSNDKNDQPKNIEKITSVDGSKYVGGFKDSLMNGQGTDTFANGDVYVGEFRNNVPHGHGTMTIDDVTLIGEFRNGEYIG